MSAKEIAQVVAGERKWHVEQGDCRELLRLLPDNCIDAVVVDLPYDLSNDGKASPGRVALEVLLPEQSHFEPKREREDYLSFLVAKVLRLRGIDWQPGPAASVPVVAVTLDNQPACWNDDIEDGRVPAIDAAGPDRLSDCEAKRSEYLGCFALECADPEALLGALNCAGCGFTTGGIGIGFSPLATSLPGLFACGGVIDDSDPVVRLRHDALTHAVRALWRAEDLPMARLHAARGSVDELSADGALMLLAVLDAGGAKLIGASPATRRLSAKLETRRVRVIGDPADRTVTFDILLHPTNLTTKGFMGSDWDGTKIAFNVDMWRDVYRVLKPGGHVLAFGGTRTYHRLACAIEDAGFIIRDQVDWLYGEGMPKGQSISKAIDRKAGATRRVIGTRVLTGNAAQTTKEKGGTYAAGTDSRGVPAKTVDVTEAATDEAKQWEGYGTGLKPGHEPIAMAMKPLDGTFEHNVRKWGVGAINVAACRVGNDARSNPPMGAPENAYGGFGATATATIGRWPANLILSHSEACQLVGSRKVKAAPSWNDNRPPSLFTGTETSPVHHTDGDGFETVEDWRCADGCPVGALTNQGGIRTSGMATPGHEPTTSGIFNPGGTRSLVSHADTGSVSRYFTTFPFEPFFYDAKPSQTERERGCESLPEETVDDGRLTPIDNPYLRGKKKRKNTHTTVKPVGVVRWCTRLIAPPGSLVLDMTCGSGTGGIAALAEGCRWLGFELMPKHVEISVARIVGDAPLLNAIGAAR
jgi:DNA modification methylase